MKSTFDKNAEKFVNLMVEKIESLSMNWQKPWFSKVNSKQNFLPQNLTGRTYSGGNAFLLYFLCEKYNYQTPVFLTFNQARNEGINVLKGAAAFPVYYTLFCAYHRQTNEKISYDEYKKLSEEEQKEYRLAAYTKYFQVFNLDQTNFAEKYPNRWDILKAKFSGEEQPQEEKEMYVNPILDEMNKNQNWVCPIQTVSSDSAFYSISNDSITLPLKSQFKDGESFYGTELHEMGHSTGVKNRLNRKGFYENDKFNYGREELVAELISALSGVYLGISVTVREENAAYLKSWCKAIKEEPKFLFTVLADAIKGSKFIAQHLNIRLDVEEVEEEKNTKVAYRFLPPKWGEFFFQTPKKNQKGLIASLCYAPIVLLSINPPTLLRYVSLSLLQSLVKFHYLLGNSTLVSIAEAET